MDDMHRSQYRLPSTLYEMLQAAAKQAGRSLNAEVVHRLQASFSSPVSNQDLPALIEDAVRKAMAEKSNS